MYGKVTAWYRLSREGKKEGKCIPMTGERYSLFMHARTACTRLQLFGDVFHQRSRGPWLLEKVVERVNLRTKKQGLGPVALDVPSGARWLTLGISLRRDTDASEGKRRKGESV